MGVLNDKGVNIKHTPRASPAPDLLVNPRSISTEGKYQTPYFERLMCQKKKQPSYNLYSFTFSFT